MATPPLPAPGTRPPAGPPLSTFPATSGSSGHRGTDYAGPAAPRSTAMMASSPPPYHYSCSYYVQVYHGTDCQTAIPIRPCTLSVIEQRPIVQHQPPSTSQGPCWPCRHQQATQQPSAHIGNEGQRCVDQRHRHVRGGGVLMNPTTSQPYAFSCLVPAVVMIISFLQRSSVWPILCKKAHYFVRYHVKP